MNSRNIDALIAEYRALNDKAGTPNLTEDERYKLIEEAANKKAYVAHLRGYSDITTLRDGGIYKEEYFAHVPTRIESDTEGMYTRRARKVRKEDNKRHVLEFYKYNKSMINTKTKYYKILCHLYVTLSYAFGRYGMDARLQHGSFIVDSSILKRLKLSIDNYTKEFECIVRTKRMRSLHGAYIPDNLMGSHRLISLTEECMDWLYGEETLEGLRQFVSDSEGNFDDTWSAQGVITPYCLETILRIALRPNKYLIRQRPPGRTIVRYKYTKDMIDYLPLPQDNKVYIDNLKIRSLVKLLSTSFNKSIEVYKDTFLYEMEAIQAFADQVYET